MFEIPHLMVTHPKYLSKIVHFTGMCSQTKYKQQISTKTLSYQNGLKCLLLCISGKWFRMKDMCLSVKSTVTGSRTGSKSAINQFSFLTPVLQNISINVNFINRTIVLPLKVSFTFSEITVSAQYVGTNALIMYARTNHY